MAKETKRLCHHIAHTPATSSRDNASYSGILGFALCATITISQEFLRAQPGTFPSTCPLCQPCVSGEGWSTCLGPGRTRSARKGASVDPVVVTLQWWRCAAATLSGHTCISWCFLLCPLLQHLQLTVYPGPAPGSCVYRLSPGLAKPSGELEGHWAGDAAWACQLGIVTVWQQGAGLAFWAIKILPLIRMVACFLALLASLPNSFVIISIVMSWPRGMVTLAFPVTLGMISLCLRE